MTLPLLRKLRITRLSRQVWTTSLSLAALCVFQLSTTNAQRPSLRTVFSQDEIPRIQLIDDEDNSSSSSLDRLKERSAQDRFERIRQEAAQTSEPPPLLEPAEAAPIPVAPPAPAENKLPRLPDLDELEEFDPFVESQKQLQSVPAQPKRIVRPVPSPEPVLMPEPSAPVYSLFQDPGSTGPKPSAFPDIVRSLEGIQPTLEYQFTRKDDYAQDDDVNIDPTRVPRETPFPEVIFEERLSPDSLFAWEASNLFHNPLYFEDPTLERYGHVHPCIQPFISLTRIGVQLVGLPYQSVIDTPWTRRYILGWYSPGDPVPHLFYQVPLNGEAALAEAAAITGAVLIVP